MDEVAAAIADPVRRDILVMLRDASLTAGQIAGRFAISRPAVSRHLRVLREAGLVRDTADGRRRVYELVTAPLEELTAWVGRLRRPAGWEHHLDALETEVHRARRERRREVRGSAPERTAGTARESTAGTARESAARAARESTTETVRESVAETARTAGAARNTRAHKETA